MPSRHPRVSQRSRRQSNERSMSSGQARSCEVAVIGAGPYGLSVAAHLKRAGIATHVFGEPMGFWRQNMPQGMRIRSPWRATHLSDPDRALSLDAYASSCGLDSAKPLSLEKFIAYGDWFQRHAVPDVDRRAVRLIDTAGNGFRLELADGGTLSADRVVVATGLLNQDYRPPLFDDLPRALVSHASEHADLSHFRGKHVAVIGRGQSACESAALLNEAGAVVEMISHGPIHWLGVPTNGTGKTLRLRLREMLASPSEVGPFPLSWLVEVPGLVRLLPPQIRAEFTRRCLKAGATGWLKPRFTGIVCNPGRVITAARALGDRIAVDLDNAVRTFDHVLLGTGYRIDISRLGILAPQLLERIARADGSPLLAPGLESSVAKLHFVGCYAVKSFGPLLRFIAGAPYAARAVADAARRGVLAKPDPALFDRLFGAAATQQAE
jgi:cation diffusion facilitator CzcD-associated flavoprotein CzcO